MDNETLFYICGIALAVSAVVFSFLGLKAKNFPGRAFPAVVLWFAILAIGAATYSVLHAQDEEHHKAAELEKAGHEFEEEGEDVEATEAPTAEEEEAEAKPAAKGPGGTLALAADSSALAYDKASLSSKPGKVTIDFTNPGPLEHDVVIEGADGEELGASEIIGKGETAASAELAAGSYTFFCSVPGHREAGMEGPLTVR